MRPIPLPLREDMSADIFYKVCCLSKLGGCGGRIEFHHNLIHAGRQVNEKWCILPICHEHHLKSDHSPIKRHLNWIMLNRATDQELKDKSRAVNWLEMKIRLNKIYDKN